MKNLQEGADFLRAFGALVRLDDLFIDIFKLRYIHPKFIFHDIFVFPGSENSEQTVLIGAAGVEEKRRLEYLPP